MSDDTCLNIHDDGKPPVGFGALFVLDAALVEIEAADIRLARRRVAMVGARQLVDDLRAYHLPVDISLEATALQITIHLPGQELLARGDALFRALSVEPDLGTSQPRAVAEHVAGITPSPELPEVPEFLQPQPVQPEIAPAAPAAPVAVRPAPQFVRKTGGRAPASGKTPSERRAPWSAEEIESFVTDMADKLREGATLIEAYETLAPGLGRTVRSLQTFARGSVRAAIEANLAANPISPEAAARYAARRTAASAASRAGRADVWTAEDDAKLVGLVVEFMHGGLGKMAAIHEAAKKMGRSERSGESKIFGKLAKALDAELAKGAVQKANTPPNAWTAEEDERLVQIMAADLALGVPLADALAAAAAVLGRRVGAVDFRLRNTLRPTFADALDKAKAAALRGAEQKSEPLSSPDAAPAAAVAVELKTPVVAECSPAAGGGDGVSPPPSGPVADIAQAVTPSPAVVQVAAPVATPAARKALPPRPDGRASQVAAPDDATPIIRHLLAATKGDVEQLRRDFSIIHLACAGWPMGDIATDLGMDSRAVKERFEVLCHYDPATKKGRYLRSHVYQALEELLTPKAVA